MKDEIKPPQTKYTASKEMILASFEILRFACIAEGPRKTCGRPAEDSCGRGSYEHSGLRFMLIHPMKSWVCYFTSSAEGPRKARGRLCGRHGPRKLTLKELTNSPYAHCYIKHDIEMNEFIWMSLFMIIHMNSYEFHEFCESPGFAAPRKTRGRPAEGSRKGPAEEGVSLLLSVSIKFQPSYIYIYIYILYIVF